MKRAIRIVVIVFAVLVLLVIAAVIIAPLVINPNDYKGDITALVKQNTGRELRIPGKLTLSVFPWLGVQIGQASLSNAPGFGKAPFDPAFAQVKDVEVRVKLLPLFTGKVEVGTVVLDGLRLDLQRNAQGKTNWADLLTPPAANKAAAGKAATPAPRPASGAATASPLAALAIGNLEIRDAGVRWRDAQQGQHVTIAHFNLSSGAIRPDSPFPLRIDFSVHSTKPALDTRVKLESRVTLDLQAQTLRLAGLNFSGAGLKLAGDIEASRILEQPDAHGNLTLTIDKAAALLKLASTSPGGGAHANTGVNTSAASPLPRPQGLDGTRLSVPFTLSLSQQTATVKGLNLQGPGGLELKGNVAVRRLLEAPTLTALITTNRFSPRKAMTELGLSLPPTADPGVLDQASLSTELTAGPDRVQLDKLKLGVDATTLGGMLSVRNFARPVIRFQLSADNIDADRYLPPPTQGKTTAVATPATAAAGASSALPVALLRKLDIDGTLKLARLKIANLHSTDLSLALRGKDGRFKLAPIAAKLYQGSYAGNMGLDVSGKSPHISMDEALRNVHLGPLLKDLSNTDRLSGIADIQAQLTATGIDPEAIKRSARGTARFALRNGALKDVNIDYEICRAYALAKRQPAPTPGTQKTDFSTVSGSLTLADGIARNNDLALAAPLLKLTGKGSANLLTNRLDYNTDVVLAKSFKCASGAELSDLKWVSIPLHIGGSFAKPTFRLDLQRAFKAAADRKIQQKQQEVRGKVKQKEQELKNKAKDKLQEGLKKLFKF